MLVAASAVGGGVEVSVGEPQVQAVPKSGRGATLGWRCEGGAWAVRGRCEGDARAV